MTGRERVLRILNRQEVDRSAFWMGMPEFKAFEMYKKAFNVQSLEELSAFMQDDIAWIMGDNAPYLDPNGHGVWDTTGDKNKKSLGAEGEFGSFETADEVKNASYPNAEYMNFEALRPLYENAKEREIAVFSGMWAPIWHVITDLFGMENCFIKMYTDPDMIHEAMRHITDFYLAANKRIFELFGDYIDVYFFGNDMGSQLDTLISPDMYRKFIFPYYREIIDLAKSYNKKVALHSCGAISRIIPDIIDMGVDILHPIQAKAVGMEAINLKKYSDKLVFMGGIDTQDILPFKSAEDVADEVIRVRTIFGNHFITSPSHEALLDNVTPANLLALRDSSLKLLDV